MSRHRMTIRYPNRDPVVLEDVRITYAKESALALEELKAERGVVELDALEIRFTGVLVGSRWRLPTEGNLERTERDLEGSWVWP